MEDFMTILEIVGVVRCLQNERPVALETIKKAKKVCDDKSTLRNGVASHCHITVSELDALFMEGMKNLPKRRRIKLRRTMY